MTAHVTLIGLDDRQAWEAAAAHGLPSHGWAYAAGLAAAGLDPRLAVVEAGGARLILPFHVRPWGGAADIATLPGLSGALVTPPGANAPPLFEAWRAHAAAAGWVSGYVQLSVLNGDLAAPPGDRIAAHNALFVFDLDRWEFERDVRKKVRWGLRSGDRAGARLVTGTGALAEAFLRLYPAAMERLEAEIFAPRTLRIWLDDPALRLFGAEVDGRIEAVELCRVRGDLAELHLAGSSVAGRGLHGWLIWRMAEWFRADGVRRFNIGGYGTEGDGLHAMKRRFGATEHPLRSLHQIYDRAAYDRLCAEAGCDPDPAYFPAYRAR